jgi:hypothetical protein
MERTLQLNPGLERLRFQRLKRACLPVMAED